MNITASSAAGWEDYNFAVFFDNDANNNTFEDSYISSINMTAIKIFTQINIAQDKFSYYNLIRNNTIEDSYVGINFQTVSNNIINNTIRNTTHQAILYNHVTNGEGYGLVENITNNTIINAGNATRKIGFKSSLSPIHHGVTDYNSAVVFVTAAGAGGDLVSADDQTVVTPDGTNDFYLCAGNAAALGGDGTLYVDSAIGIDCATLFVSVGGTAACSQVDFMTHNGYGNYTVAALTGCDGIVTGYTDPTYLRYANDSFQQSFPVQIKTYRNSLNISGNTFETTDGRQNYYSMNVTADSTLTFNTNVWLNNFYSSGVVYANNVYFCAENEGNFYEESLAPVAGDCGQSNITYPANGTILLKNTNTTTNVS
jgi:hypothetical protein